MHWWANVFQHITVKNGTMPVIWGDPGSGKSFPIEVFSELLSNLALHNVDDLNKVFGKFNGLEARHHREGAPWRTSARGRAPRRQHYSIQVTLCPWDLSVYAHGP